MTEGRDEWAVEDMGGEQMDTHVGVKTESTWGSAELERLAFSLLLSSS